MEKEARKCFQSTGYGIKERKLKQSLIYTKASCFSCISYARKHRYVDRFGECIHRSNAFHLLILFNKNTAATAKLQFQFTFRNIAHTHTHTHWVLCVRIVNIAFVIVFPFVDAIDKEWTGSLWKLQRNREKANSDKMLEQAIEHTCVWLIRIVCVHARGTLAHI